MENPPRIQENNSPSLLPSPNSHSSNSSTSSNGFLHHHHHPSPPSPRPPQPPPTVPITRSEPNSPYPTTFVQADTTSFKKVVQMLTGSSDTVRLAASRPEPVRSPIPPIKTAAKKDKSASKLFERRSSLKNFKISPLGPGLANTRPGGHSGTPRPGTPEILSPSILDFPSLVLSPVTPLIPDPFNRSPLNNVQMEAEEKAIKEKGFYLHQSPATTPRDSEPRLLPLFPVTSPRVANSSNASNS